MENKEKCPCCGYLTIDGNFDICSVCYWQKDSYQEKNVNDSGGPNLVSLREARENFKKFKASEEKFISQVRSPTSEEIS